MTEYAQNKELTVDYRAQFMVKYDSYYSLLYTMTEKHSRSQNLVFYICSFSGNGKLLSNSDVGKITENYEERFTSETTQIRFEAAQVIVTNLLTDEVVEGLVVYDTTESTTWESVYSLENGCYLKTQETKTTNKTAKELKAFNSFLNIFVSADFPLTIHFQSDSFSTLSNSDLEQYLDIDSFNDFDLLDGAIYGAEYVLKTDYLSYLIYSRYSASNEETVLYLATFSKQRNLIDTKRLVY
tara:strand:- start:119 stop:838 length:720 start_codon:yes stop_codon:yes gene_type:complete